MKILNLFLVLGLFVITAQAEVDAATVNLDQIKNLLLKHKQVSGSFKQVRTLVEPKINLTSEGDFKFKLPLDLEWNQTKPFSMALLMTPDKITQINPDGSQQIITKAQQPVVFVFSSSFLGIFSGDQKSIEKNFNYKAQITGRKWSLQLIPKDDLLKKAIAEVKINGADYVEKVEVREASGGSTVIQFLKVKGRE